MSISSINRPNLTVPKNVTYLSCIALSVPNGIMADVNESCIVRGINSSIDFGAYCNKCSRLCAVREYVVWMPNFFVMCFLTKKKISEENLI